MECDYGCSQLYFITLNNQKYSKKRKKATTCWKPKEYYN